MRMRMKKRKERENRFTKWVIYSSQLYYINSAGNENKIQLVFHLKHSSIFLSLFLFDFDAKTVAFQNNNYA